MIQLHENEHIVLLLHKHWFVMARTAIGIVLMLALAAGIFAFLPMLTVQFDSDLVSSLAGFGLAVYLMIVLLFAFFSWMDYYLDMWIVTEKRVINIDQQGLFSREISEVPMASIQDVTIDVAGLAETLLAFGTIRIQTAGEREFRINDIPHLNATKDAILEYAHRQFDATEQQFPTDTQATEKISDIPDA